MNKHLNLCLLCLLSVFFPSQIIAQTEDPFWLKMEGMFAKIELKDKNKNVVFSGPAFVEESRSVWKGIPALTEAQPGLMGIIDKMQTRRFKPYEHFVPLIKTLLLTGKKHPTEVKGFLEALDYLLAQPGTPRIMEWFEMNRALLADSVLSTHKGITWKSSGGPFQIYSRPAPGFEFSKTDLICHSGKSIRHIPGTSGKFDPFTTQWVGRGGRMDWVSSGKIRDSVSVELSNWSIQMQGTELKADSVILYHLGYFPEGIRGKFEDNLRPGSRTDLPRFESYSYSLTIPNLRKSVQYRGGIRLEGNELTGVGIPGHPANITFLTGHMGKVNVSARVFSFRGSHISAKDAFASIRYQKDSIYHPSISFNYDEKRRQLTLYQGSSILSGMPFFDSYQRVEVQAHSLQWNIDDTLVSFSRGAGLVRESDAYFVSGEYYRESDFKALQGMDPVNPLVYLYNYSKSVRKQEFPIQEYARAAGLSVEQARLQLMPMAAKGFLLYDFDTQIVYLRDKLFHWVDSFHGKKDFDNLVIFSDSAKINARLNLRNMDLQVFHVDQVILSDSQRVAITPYGYTLVMKENRNIAYSGRAMAGFFDFFSNRRNLFLYDEFRLSLPEIDSIRFMALDGKFGQKEDGRQRVRIRSVIEQVSGTLQIDHPDNKSGRKNFRIPFPVFKTDSSHSFVFYDKGRHGRFYPRKTFYYKVEPFVLNNLDNFMLDSIDLRGTLYTSGILSPMKKPLSVRPDYSLGVDVHTGKTGLGLYTGDMQPKGWFTGRIDLSLNGLRGHGSLNFLGSISATDSTRRAGEEGFLFYPDYSQALVQSFTLPEKTAPVEMPSVTGEMIHQKWQPYANLMTLKSGKQPFRMFQVMTFDGTLELSPEKLDGNGKAGFDKAMLSSDHYEFNRRSLKADSARFSLKTPDDQAIALNALNYQANIDFDKGTGQFMASTAPRVDYPVFSMVSDHRRFDWDMGLKRILFSSPGQEQEYKRILSLSPSQAIVAEEAGELKGPSFLYLRPDLDSLRFYSFTATYHIDQTRIDAGDVPFIRTADALIYVPEKKLSLTPVFRSITIEGGKAATKQGEVIHELYDVHAEVISGKRFKGRGDCYYSGNKTRENRIRLINLESNPSTGKTTGKGSLADTSGFRLSSDFGFYGDVLFSSDKAALGFRGYFKALAAACPHTANPWVQFDTLVEAGSVMLPFPKQAFTSDFREPVTGVFSRRMDGGMYAAWLMPLADPKDTPLIRAYGAMLYDETHQDFRCGPPAVLANPAHRGNMIMFDPGRCLLRAKGVIDLQPVFSPLAQLRTAGTLSYSLASDSLTMDLLLAFDFPFIRQAFQTFENDLFSADNPHVNVANGKYRQQLIEWLGESDYSALMADVESSAGKAGGLLKALLVLGDVHFVWDSVEQVYNSKGPISVLFFNGVNVGRKYSGGIQLTRKHGSREDRLRILIRIDEYNYYYFDYGRGNVMRVYSTNKEFTDLLQKHLFDLNKKFEKEHEGRRWQPYKVSLVNRSEAIDFRAEVEKFNSL